MTTDRKINLQNNEVLKKIVQRKNNKSIGVVNKKNLVLVQVIIFLLLVFFLNLFNSYAQSVDVTNTGTLYISSGEIFSAEGSFTNSGSGSTTNEGLIYLNKNWINDGSFLSETGKVTFWGTSAQTISGTSNTSFFDATINNSAGVNLSQTISVDGTLELSLGKITTSTNEVHVTNNNVNSINPYSSTSYIIGNLRRNVAGTGSYNFPLGTASEYEHANIDLSSTTGFTNLLGTFTTASPGSVPSGLTINGSPINGILDYGYWTITPNTSMTGGAYTVSISENGASNSVLAANRYGVLKRVNSGNPWQSLGTHLNSTQSVSGSTITAVRSDLTSFSDFSIGYTSGGFPLPIELLSFNATLNKHVVDIKWATESEHNSDYFIVERSVDAIHFSEIEKLFAAGNSNEKLNYKTADTHPFFGVSYYRLKQVDLDGTFAYSKTELVCYQNELFNFMVLPNPTTSENLNLKITGAKDYKINIVLTDASGKNYFKSEVIPDNNFFNYEINTVQKIPTGYYLIEIFCNGKSYTKQIVVQ